MHSFASLNFNMECDLLSRGGPEVVRDINNSAEAVKLQIAPWCPADAPGCDTGSFRL